MVFAVLTGGPAAAGGPNASLSTTSAFTYDGCATHVVAVAEVDDGPDGETASYEDVDASVPVAARGTASVQGYLYDSPDCSIATNTADNLPMTTVVESPQACSLTFPRS